MSDKGASDEEFKQWSENIALGDNDALSPSTINLVSAIIPSISDASISFQGKLIEHVFETQGDVWKSLRSHYSSEALRQIYKVSCITRDVPFFPIAKLYSHLRPSRK